MTGSDWLTTGTSALRYDPISGDGTGTSLRSAILACAALRSATENSKSECYLEYYRRRSIAAFCQHLHACEALYESAGFSVAWNEELRSIRKLVQLANISSGIDTPAFRLCDYRLRAVSGS